jgi:6-phospho-beta-glucosidase
MKVTVIGCGLRTPLLAHGLAHSGLGITELTLFDENLERSRVMAALCCEIAKDTGIRVSPAVEREAAIEDANFVISSIRVGGMESRARDERLVLDHGFAGQETTGPVGLAMALRTIPVAIDLARTIERRAPRAWLVNFTNPAGLITQAISTHTGARVVGICDTPAELFFRISLALEEPVEELDFDYLGLNHLGWVRSVRKAGRDVTHLLLNDDIRIASLYPAKLFEPSLIRALGLVPTEYVYFYYETAAALQNIKMAGTTRGEELLRMNDGLLSGMSADVAGGRASQALERYRRYLNRRNASYMRLEGAAQSASSTPEPDWNPFEGATGYHRIAIEVMRALTSAEPAQIVLNVPNDKTMSELAREDVIEVPCRVNRDGPRPIATGPLPGAVAGLVTAVKSYERLAIRAAVEQSASLAVLALFVNPIVGNWEAAKTVVAALRENDPRYLGYLCN